MPERNSNGRTSAGGGTRRPAATKSAAAPRTARAKGAATRATTDTGTPRSRDASKSRVAANTAVTQTLKGSGGRTATKGRAAKSVDAATPSVRGRGRTATADVDGSAGRGRGGRNLVIVESPTKARTLQSFLGRDYDVQASIGHVRDLPKSKLGVDVDHGFVPQYVIPREKSDVVKKLSSAAKSANIVYLATDPDREGEAISWHLVEAMGLRNRPLRRVEFHEITRDAVRDAFEHPRELNLKLVEAQQARRVLDRLVGYKISPLLWKKVRRGLSAGRVQSVALRMIVEREREIQQFQAREYWTLDAGLLKPAEADVPFRARLAGYLNERRRELQIATEDAAEAVRARLAGSTFQVSEVRRRTQNRRPAPPFTTSTLQQEASRRLGFSAKRTMTVAQQLYEGREVAGEGQVGLITYMRTDSTNVSAQAVQATRDLIASRFGTDFVPAQPRVFTKKAKGAQEAHEAIRPTDVMREPEALRRSLTTDQLKLYTLIWQRMVASQMAEAVLDVTSVDIAARPADGVDPYLLRASSTRMRFPGFRAVYFEERDDGIDEDAETRALPNLVDGDALQLLDVSTDQHFTEPPPRFTEASLVKALEENGIGRPSTYAATLSTLQDRGYVERAGRQLRPLELGFLVTDLLTEHFSDFVDVAFTAGMEEGLDDVAEGSRSWQPLIQEYYTPLMTAVEKAADLVEPVVEASDQICPECEAPMVVRWGRYGKFYACSRYPECKGSRPLEGQAESEAVTDEFCPTCNATMTVKMGRFGKFLACSRYPECKGAKPFLTKIGVPCPDCDNGQVVQRKTRGRGGRVFYGCSNYPNCNFTSWVRPQAERCPSCGYLTAQDGQEGVRCLKCAWRGQTALAEAG